MEVFWVVLITTLLTFCFVKVYWTGYKVGARKILAEWKKTINYEGDKEP